MADIQSALEAQYCPLLDLSLVAAIAYEPCQTLQSAKELCEMLAAAALVENAEASNDTHNHDIASSITTSTSLQGTVKEPAAKTKTTQLSRRRNFGGKLTTASSSNLANASPKSISPQDSPVALSTVTFEADLSSGSGINTPTTDVDSVQRLLDEWSLMDSSTRDPDNLRLTDEEAESDSELASVACDSLENIQAKEIREATALGQAAGQGTIDPEQITSGQVDVRSPKLTESISKGDAFDPLSFLQHAFPSRTTAFLRETLDDSKGEVQAVVDTLMTIDLLESEDARQAELGNLNQQDKVNIRERARGLDYDVLARGLMSAGGMDANLKGKKRKAARRKLQAEQRKAKGQADDARQSKGKPKVKVILTDIRHSAPVNFHSTKTVRPTKIKANMTDEELAAKLDAEERALAMDPDDGQPVRDNQWLLTSSVLSQLSTLLDLESTSITSIYNASSFNLGIAFARVLEFASDRYPSLDSLDEAGDAPPGTARQMSEGIVAIADTDRERASKAFRATKGRQDATLDLLQLEDVVKAAMGGELTDALDPLGKLARPEEAEVISVKAANAKGVSIKAGAASGKFRENFPTPSQAVQAGNVAYASDSKYSKAIGRRQAGPPISAAAALMHGATIGTVIPASAAPLSHNPDVGLSDIPNERLGLAPHISAYDPTRRMAEYRLISDEYHQRRDEALHKAADAWRNQRGGVRAGSKSGDGGRGGIAWYYADEARRLDAKSRAWSLKAAQALVEDRRNGNIGVIRADTPLLSSQVQASNTIDLHGVTVHEALSIVREQVTKWYARPGSHLAPFRIITGVGRHSPHQIAILRPAVANVLTREGWKFDVENQRGVIVVRGVK